MKKIIADIEVHAEHALLDQYKNSEHFRHRFYIAAHNPGEEIARSNKTTEKVITDQDEIDQEAFGYFLENNKQMRKEYFGELKERIKKKKAKHFINTISKEWADGKSKRIGENVNGIRLAVKEYIDDYYENNNHEILSFLPEAETGNKILNSEDINEIVQLNKQWLTRELYNWQNHHSEANFLSMNTIYLRRGLGLAEKNLKDIQKKDKRLYPEFDFINSYSLAISTPEQFTQIQKNSIPIIVNMNYSHLEEHILFFAPLIKKMSTTQFEFGVIPRPVPEVLDYQGKFGGIHEFLLEQYV